MGAANKGWQMCEVASARVENVMVDLSVDGYGYGCGDGDKD